MSHFIQSDISIKAYNQFRLKRKTDVKRRLTSLKAVKLSMTINYPFLKGIIKYAGLFHEINATVIWISIETFGFIIH